MILYFFGCHRLCLLLEHLAEQRYSILIAPFSVQPVQDCCDAISRILFISALPLAFLDAFKQEACAVPAVSAYNYCSPSPASLFTGEDCLKKPIRSSSMLSFRIAIVSVIRIFPISATAFPESTLIISYTSFL